MAKVYRRNGRTHHDSDYLDSAYISTEPCGLLNQEFDDKAKSNCVVRWIQRRCCFTRSRCASFASSASVLSNYTTVATKTQNLSYRITQTLWLVLMVYAFLGLPLLGRILNFVRYLHRFTILRIGTGLTMGAFQDVAIFAQASTLIALIKSLWTSLLSRLRRNTLNAQERYPHNQVNLPLYLPVRTNDFETNTSNHPTSHQNYSTIIKIYQLSYCNRFLQSSVHTLGTILVFIVLVLSTIASLSDFCLQVTLHPRLNRAFVEIFINYTRQFTASLLDEEVLTPSVIIAWITYIGLILSLTYGHVYDRIPTFPDLIQYPTSSYWKQSKSTTVPKPYSLTTNTIFYSLGITGLVSLGALMSSLLVHTPASASRNKQTNQWLNVDMQQMSNAMFTLQVEPLFIHKTQDTRGAINCTSASTTLLNTLGMSEQYNTLRSSDSCALLWRKTTGFQGETHWNINWNKSTNHTTLSPNILVLNMESWRALDIGVLGGKDKKQRYNVSATPYFDQLTQDGILYTKHYSPCVQTTRTLLTMLFGMYPSCTETTALKRYGTKLKVHGLPQFLKSRGYFNLFWSAVDLTWEYWNVFLLMNGFDTLVDETVIRDMLHRLKQYQDREDDHFSWGMHDEFSFEMLLYAIEQAHTRTFTNQSGWEQLRAPYFIDMYTITSHNPWALPLDYKLPDLSRLYTRYNKRYIDAMYYSDEMLGQFINNMRSRGLMKNTIVIIQGDHGYGRLEHDNPSIADSRVYEEGTHVPFLILADDFLSTQERGTVVDQVSMQSDLMATIADLLGVSEQDPLYQHGYGHSMRRKRPLPQKEFEVATHPENITSRRVLLCNPFDGMTKGVRTEELKYVFNSDGSFRVYELASDPLEHSYVTKGYDQEQMDQKTLEMFNYVNHQVDLNQFLYETNNFITTRPNEEEEIV